ILGRYFPGLVISAGAPNAAATAAAAWPVPPRAAPTRPTPIAAPAPNVLVTLPDDDEGERATIVKQTLKNRDDLARVLRVSAPAPVILRFHPTTDDYESATGRAWFTSASLVN